MSKYFKLLAIAGVVLEILTMSHIKRKDHVYDIVVIGAGLSGLISAAALAKEGMDVCVLESAEFSGGHSRLVYSPVGLIDNGIKFFPDNLKCTQALEQLNHILKVPIEFGSVENGPVTFQGGEIKPFIGFGKEAPDFHRELSYFLEPRRLELSRSVGQIVADLALGLGERFYPSSLVTKYQGHEGKIQSVMVNGQREIFGREFIHSASPKILSALLDDELLSVRAKQKIAKADYWTILGLDLFHSGTVTESQFLHLLNGTTQDELGPSVGLFHPTIPSVKNDEDLIQHSQWMTFVEQEAGEDPEFTGSALKKIKRQIKRAYPQALEGMISERILVAPLMEVDLELKFDQRGALHGIPNLWLAHGSASQGLNIVGSIQQSLLVASQINNMQKRIASPEKDQ